MISKQIRILIVEDNINYAKQLNLFLSKNKNMAVVGTANSQDEAYQIIKTLQPDIILLDLYLNEAQPEGIDIIKKTVQICNAKIIVLTSADDPELVKEALLSGAKEYIVKENLLLLPEMIKAISKRPSSAEIMKGIAESYEKILKTKTKKDLFHDFNLTPREEEVFDYLEKDFNRGQIATQLCTSESTIKNHVSSILKKLSVSNVKEALDKINNIIGEEKK